MRERLYLFDTTLRDGQQTQGVQFSAAEKAEIARMLDALGVDYIEGGWPGALPKDTEFFALAAKELDLEHATLAAFGATRRVGAQAHEDPVEGRGDRALNAAGAMLKGGGELHGISCEC